MNQLFLCILTTVNNIKFTDSWKDRFEIEIDMVFFIFGG